VLTTTNDEDIRASGLQGTQHKTNINYC
jgi:hypothetical protein